MRRLRIWLLVLSVLMACTDRTPEPEAFWTGAWIVTDVQPLLADMQDTRSPEVARAAMDVPAPKATAETASPIPAIGAGVPEAGRPVIDWRNPLEGWLTVDAYLATQQQAPEIDTARSLLILSLTLNDTLHAARAARGAGLSISDDAALAAAASGVLPVSRGLAGRGASVFAAEALAEVAVDDATRRASRQLGISVARVVLDRLSEEPTLIGVADNIQVIAGTDVGATVSISDQQALLAALPASEAARAEVLAWYSPQAPALPFRWMVLAGEQAAGAELNFTERAGLYVRLAVAMADSATLCAMRSEPEANERPADWLAKTRPGWEPVVPAPADSPMQRSCMSAAAAEILTARFPAARDVFAATAAETDTAALAAALQWPMEITAANAVGQAVAQQVLAAPVPAGK
jgi:hypothetical protein